MATHRLFWRELVRAWAQWVGLGIAAIPAGIILGSLERQGVSERASLTIALIVGFVLALGLWILIGRHFSVLVVQYTQAAASPTILQFAGEQGALIPAGAFAVAVLAVSVYCVQLPSHNLSTSMVSIAVYAPAAA